MASPTDEVRDPRTVKIPDESNPFVVIINNKKYSYPAGTEQTVPDEVADVIDNYWRNKPKKQRNALGTGNLKVVYVDYDKLEDFTDEIGTGKVFPFTYNDAKTAEEARQLTIIDVIISEGGQRNYLYYIEATGVDAEDGEPIYFVELGAIGNGSGSSLDGASPDELLKLYGGL